jgi:hypothetical protein
MITVNKIITLNPAVDSTGPYTWTLSATDTPVSGCVSFSQTTGVIVNPATEVINVDIEFFNQTCLEDSTISLVVTYNEGTCSTTFPITIEDPCSSFTVGTITHQAPFTFSVAPTGGSPNYSYTWVYDESVFTTNQSQTFTNVLVLEPIGSGQLSFPLPQTTTIQVFVTDQNGCTASQTQTFTLCGPTVENYLLSLGCAKVDGNPSNTLCIIPVGCNSIPLDLDSFVFTTTAPGLSVSASTTSLPSCEDAGGKRFIITATNGVTPVGTHTIEYYVVDVNGVQSNTGTITVTVPDCSSSPGSGTVTLESPLAFTIPCTAIITDIYEIGPMTNYVTATNTIDWTTFDLIDPATGAGSGTGPLTTAAGATVNFNTSTLKVEYEIPALTGADSFQWTVCDTNGECALNGTITMLLDCSLEPVAVADSDCGVCNETIEHDVLANDTLNGTLHNLTVITSPTNGTAAFNNDFSSPRILYTANAGYSGSDSYEYRVRNTAGEFDTATVTVTVICAGTDSELVVCE